MSPVVNAAGGRVVTAPTNGAAGVIPAVLKVPFPLLPQCETWLRPSRFLIAVCSGVHFRRARSGREDFPPDGGGFVLSRLCDAGTSFADLEIPAVGMLYKRGSTISAAEGGYVSQAFFHSFMKRTLTTGPG